VVVVEGEGAGLDEEESVDVVGSLVELAGLPVPVWVTSVVAPGPLPSPLAVGVPAPIPVCAPAAVGPLGPVDPADPVAGEDRVVGLIAASTTAAEKLATPPADASATASSDSALIARSSARPARPGSDAAGRAPVIVVGLISISVWSWAAGTNDPPPLTPGRDEAS
jgi:hypothetical protein